MTDGLRAVVVGRAGRVVCAVDFEEGGFDERGLDQVVAVEVFDQVDVGGAGAAPGHGGRVEGECWMGGRFTVEMEAGKRVSGSEDADDDEEAGEEASC